MMAIPRADDASSCYALSSTLIGAMISWYNTLWGKQFDSFEELSLDFSNYFTGSKLLPLRNYIKHFQDKAIQVSNLSEETRLLATM